ncbi:class F sortase [Micromonospora sp. CMU55-4]|nr:class F sortase [Micromonospora sp. CMU55-4]
MAEHFVPPPAGSRRSGWPFVALPPPAAPPTGSARPSRAGPPADAARFSRADPAAAPRTGPRSGSGSAAGTGPSAGTGSSAGPVSGARPWMPPPAASRPWYPPSADPPALRPRPAGPPPVEPPPASPGGRDRGRGSWSKPLAVVLVLVGVFATGAGLGRTAGPFDFADASTESSRSTGSGAAAPANAAAPARKPASRPVRLAVPAIKVNAPVTPVGQAKDGSVDVPPLTEHDQTGWYDRGAVPGDPGRAIIVGHVDTKSGPAVFYRLRSLKPGARIQVTRADRSVVTFKVDSVEYFDKSNLPAARVYGDSGPAELRLITCGGEWVGGRTGYQDNVIVFASLAS